MPFVSEAGVISHAIAAIAYLGFAGALVYRRRQSAAGLWLVAACLGMFAWAAVVAFIGYGALWAQAALTIAETIRSGLWALFVAALVISNWQDTADNPSRKVFAAVAAIVALQIVVDVLAIARSGAPPFWVQYVYVLGRMAVAIGGLVLTHNAFVNSAPANRWSIRLLCIALAGIFGYDLNLYTLQLLEKSINADLFDVRGIVNALVVPLIYLSVARNRGLKLQVSRRAAFHTLSLGAIGLYLVAMSLAGYGLRLVGGDWGRLLQIAFIFGAIVLAAVVLFSGRARAWLRVQINKHFFAYKYDYRQEWLRFLNTVSSAGPGMGDLHMRVVQAVCEPVDSPGGALFIAGEDGGFDQVARWNYRTLRAHGFGGDTGIMRHVGASVRIIDVDEYRDRPDAYPGLVLPKWLLADPQAWLVIPLVHIDDVIGLILVEQPLARRALNWEDFDILRTVGRQAASYVAEAAALAKIAESRKFDEFNRRFAFIMHDLKNLVSQLSLVARNAERHADNAEFRADMVATLQQSVSKMNDLLARLAQQSAHAADASQPIDVARVAATVVAAARQRWPEIEFDGCGSPIEALGHADRLEQVLTHLVQNAIDASAPGTPIKLSIRAGDRVAVAVRDQGRGMTAEFIRSELFEPFKSTKPGGFGIGAYEAREMTRDMGGKLVVESEPGVGSCFTIFLPAVAGAREPSGRDA
jgi:putative PEP-CTERM system histidine kinase